MPLRAQRGARQKQNNKEHLQAPTGTPNIYGTQGVYLHGDIQPLGQT